MRSWILSTRIGRERFATARPQTVRTLPMLRIRQVSLGALLDIDWDNTALAAFGPQLLNGEVRSGGA